jgi:hypothetical protein
LQSHSKRKAKRLHPYRVLPRWIPCRRGPAEVEVLVLAQAPGHALALMRSLEHFAVATSDSNQRLTDPEIYPNAELAIRAFLGRASA